MRIRLTLGLLVVVAGCSESGLQTIAEEHTPKGGTPSLKVSPEAIDFGQVPVNEERRQRVYLENMGSGPVVLGADTGLAGDAVFGVMDTLAGLELGPSDEESVNVTFLPTSDADYQGTLTIASNDPERPVIEVALIGSGVVTEAPTCGLSVTSGATWNGTAYTVNALSNVTFSASSSGGATYVWSLQTRPSGSAAAINGSGASASLTPDLAGAYIVRVEVQGSDGTVSEPCEVTIQAVPTAALWVEMFWTAPNEDMDLHLTVNGAAPHASDGLFNSLDCYYSTCIDGCPGGFLCPKWGGSGTSDDPALDLDDIGGTGPENINIQSPASGTYTVYVRDFPSSEFRDTNVTTVRIYLQGVLVKTYVSTANAATAAWGSGEDQFWKVCTISMPSGGLTDHWEIF